MDMPEFDKFDFQKNLFDISTEEIRTINTEIKVKFDHIYATKLEQFAKSTDKDQWALNAMINSITNFYVVGPCYIEPTSMKLEVPAYNEHSFALFAAMLTPLIDFVVVTAILKYVNAKNKTSQIEIEELNKLFTKE